MKFSTMCGRWWAGFFVLVVSATAIADSKVVINVYEKFYEGDYLPRDEVGLLQNGYMESLIHYSAGVDSNSSSAKSGGTQLSNSIVSIDGKPFPDTMSRTVEVTVGVHEIVLRCNAGGKIHEKETSIYVQARQLYDFTYEADFSNKTCRPVVSIVGRDPTIEPDDPSKRKIKKRKRYFWKFYKN